MLLQLSVPSLLRPAGDSTPEALALLAVGRKPCLYIELVRHLERTAHTLNDLGIGRSDRVAIVLSNGPEMATCFLSVASTAISAPLNPAYSAAEFGFYLSDLKPKAVIVESGSDSPVISVARSAGISVLRLVSDREEPAGVFRLEGPPAAGRAENPGWAQPDDVALLLHTSGSTSRPKLVPLTHVNLCSSAQNIRASLGLTAADRCLNIMPLFHIHGLIGAVLSSLSAGASVVCSPGFHALHFFDWLDEFHPTWYTAVPTMHQAIVGRAAQNPDLVSRSRLRFIRSSSAALPPKLMEESERVWGVPMVEAYGMTEASHQMAINPLPPGTRKPGSVGLAAGCEIAVLDERGEFLRAGETGAVAIRGASVTRGYESNPEANQSSFTGGWFRTGDEGTLDSDGYLFLTGRTKEIINRGGEKISPREVDEVLMDHPAVAQAMAFALPDPRLGEELGVAIVLSDEVLRENALSEDGPPGNAERLEMELREFVVGRLANFKVPRRFVFLKEIPKGPTGKPQRIGLAQKLGLTEAAPAAVSAQPEFTAPGTDTERRLIAIWREVLGAAQAGIHDDFFQLGGDSILAAQLIVRVRDEFRVELPMFRLFGAPSVTRLAEWIDSAPRLEGPDAEPLRPVPRSGDLPLSFAQQRMWFLARFEEESAAYSLPSALRLQGPLRIDALQASLDRIVERHEVLRTTFPSVDGVPIQIIRDPDRVPLPVIDLGAVGESEQESRVHPMAREEAHRPFDLALDLPLRARLLRLGDDDHVLLLTVHHIATDGWSKAVLFRELTAWYDAFVTGSEPSVPALPIQYADYAVWSRRRLSGETGEGLIAYWKEQLAQSPELLELPTDHPRPVRQTFRGGLESRLLPENLHDALRLLNLGESVTLFMTLLAAFQVLLSRYSGQTDICVGSPTAHRTRKETEDLIGFFVNTLAMRTGLSGDPTFRQLLARVRETTLGAYDHQDLPLERLIEVIQPQRRLSHSPLFQVMFQLRNFPEIVTRLRGLTISPVAFDSGTAQFDLTLEITETDQGLACVLNYNSDLFDAATARRMLGHYQTLLEAAVQNPELPVSRLPILTDAERRQLLVEWNQTRAEYPRACVHQLFEACVSRTPQAVAAVQGGRRWTYLELNRRATGIARHLRSLGAGPGKLVAICAERSLEMLAGLLGIWKAGAAYVPLDPSYPKDRLSFILQDAGASVLLTQKRLRGALPESRAAVAFLEDCQDDPPDDSDSTGPSATHEHLAYVIYTSGSTGKPKGVAIGHQSLTNLLWSMSRLLEPAAGDVFLALTTISFDIAGLELFLPLITGAQTAIVSREVASDGSRLARAIEKSGATIVQATPATWQALLEAGWTGVPGLKILCGGEALARALAERLAAEGRVWNVYGPTETTIWSTAAEISTAQQAVPIGRPLANTEVYVLDRDRQPLPVGVPGELYIGGDGLARGYWKRPELTAEKFVSHPFSVENGSRLYRTGDLVRYLPGGSLEFLGRIDNQVKLRGFRIELGEIESVLSEHPSVRAAAVKLVEVTSGDKRLVAYVVPGNGARPAAAELRDYLKQKLPSYMLPSAFVPLANLPLTPNGKVDRSAIAAPLPAAKPGIGGSPQGEVETVLTQIWEDVLGRRPIGINEDFFDLGGHSLLGTRLLARVEKVFSKKLTLVNFFEAPTIAQMASLLNAGANSIAASRVIPIRSSGSRPPLFFLAPPPLSRALMLRLPEDQPIFGISVLDTSVLPVPFRLEDVAAHYIQVIREFQPQGPYELAGWCNDGVIAYEMAQQLRAQGESVPLIVMFESFNPAYSHQRTRWTARQERIRFHLANLSRLNARQVVEYTRERLETLFRRIRAYAWRAVYKFHLRVDRRLNRRLRDAVQVLRVAIKEYRPQLYEGPALLVRAVKRPRSAAADAALGWSPLVPDMQVVDVAGNHTGMFLEPNVEVMANALEARLRSIGRASRREDRSSDPLRRERSQQDSVPMVATSQPNVGALDASDMRR